MRLFFFICLQVLLLFSERVQAQSKFNYFFSNTGSDTNPGTSNLLPRLTIKSTLPLLQAVARQKGSVNLGLKESHSFNESFVPSYPVTVGAYSDGLNLPAFSVLNGSDKFDTGWLMVQGMSRMYAQNIEHYGFSGQSVGFYNYLCVIEIDREREKDEPFSARKLLKLVPTYEAVETNPGSFFEAVTHTATDVATLKVFVHTSNGSSPNNNGKYRYEVTVRERAVNAYNTDGSRFENLWIRGYGSGYGAIPGGAFSEYEKVIFGPGAAIHHLVAKSATLNNCLFLPGAENVGDNTLVFYNAEGFGRHNKVSNTIFLDVMTPIYAHNSYGSNYGAIELDHVVSFASPNTRKGFVSASNTDSLLLNEVYVDGDAIGYYNGSAPYAVIQNSYFKDMATAIRFPGHSVNATVKNVFIKCGGVGSGTGIEMGAYTKLSLGNSIIHLGKSTGGSGFITGLGGTSNQINATGNIFIQDIEPSRAATVAATNIGSGAGTSADRWKNNVYILRSGSIMNWIAINPITGKSTTINNFAEWQRLSGQDQNSLFFDIRNDPRGLKAIFIDPDNGNYELANTVYGNKIKALRAGMTTPLSCFLKKPTYEEAAEMIRTDNVMHAGSCRNPCQAAKASIKFPLFSSFNNTLSICKNDSIELRATPTFEKNDVTYHQSAARQQYLWWFSDGRDTSGINLNTVTYKFQKEGFTDIRLQLVDENGCTYDTLYSVKVNPLPEKPFLGNDTSLCTGQTLPLQVLNTQNTDLYQWSTGETGVSKIEVKAAGTFSVRSQNNTGCVMADTIVVVNKTPISVSLGNDTAFCSTQPYLLKPVIAGNVQSFYWNTGAATDTIRLTRAGTYIVTVKDPGVCIAKDTIVITENPVNTFSLPADTSICTGESYFLKLHPPPGTAVEWNDGVRGNDHVINGGTYGIVADYKGCIIEDKLTVGTRPIPVVSLGRDTTVCNGFTVPLSVQFPGADYVWSTGSRDHSIQVKNAGIYWVQLNLNNCSYRDSIELRYTSCDCNFQMANAFSPNGDGINDLIRPKMQCFPFEFSLTIFNRFGQMVYQSNDYRAYWNGQQNGKPLPAGTYYYIVQFNKDRQAIKKPLSGSISLLR